MNEAIACESAVAFSVTYLFIAQLNKKEKQLYGKIRQRN